MGLVLPGDLMWFKDHPATSVFCAAHLHRMKKSLYFTWIHWHFSSDILSMLCRTSASLTARSSTLICTQDDVKTCILKYPTKSLREKRHKDIKKPCCGYLFHNLHVQQHTVSNLCFIYNLHIRNIADFSEMSS